MKTFEEKWTAWLDGQLDEKELAEFETSLPDLAAAHSEKLEMGKLGALLREQIGAREMTNAEFFHHQIRSEIERDLAPAAMGRSEPALRETWWSIGRVLWTGAASLAVLALCTFVVLRDKEVGGQSGYLTQIVNARVDPNVSPNATISVFESKEDKVTVVWVEGLQSLPSEYAAK